jgi:multiple antibiotic resistance protein
VTWLLLLVAATRGGDAKRPGLARDMVSRYMGLIIIAMGIQFALKGYKAFMA